MIRKLLTLMILTLLAVSVTACVPVATQTQTATEGAQSAAVGTPVSATGDLKLAILYDNTAVDSRLRADWGFATLVEYGGHTVLFDTGANGPILLNNMQQMGVDPGSIEAIVISHGHYDHTSGLMALLETGIQPTVYLSFSFTDVFKDEVRTYTELVEVSDTVEVFPGMHAALTVGNGPPEQTLVIETEGGSVVLTGCAHPGVAEMVRRAQEIVPGKVALLAGGFHLYATTQSQLPLIVAELRQLGVQSILPAHCTGEDAVALFRTEFGQNFVEGGAGRTLTVSTGLSN